MDKPSLSRRLFLGTLAGGSAALAANPLNAAEAAAASTQTAAKGTRPLIISSSNGLNSLDLGMGLLRRGHDTLDAVIAVVTVVEDDPRDNSVGYGGLPNEDGEVELDASVMHGPTRRAGAVASVRRIKNVAKVAQKVMERTDHCLLVGPGAARFARAHGFPDENLLTEESRVTWLAWKEGMSDTDAWGPGLASPEWKDKTAQLLPPGLSKDEQAAMLARIRESLLHPPTGTINCCAVNEKGDISGTTTTSGLFHKLAGRVGDSPIIGAGLYVDNDVGAAGSTGRGEENIKVCGAHTIVEMMRQGKSPTEACLEACKRIVRNYNNDRARLARFSINFYALNKDGQHGGATLWGPQPGRRGAQYAFHDGVKAQLAPCAPLLERS
jgi:N4-(beta-N-acetylglucosaminyl)-L-asparaginase